MDADSRHGAYSHGSGLYEAVPGCKVEDLDEVRREFVRHGVFVRDGRDRTVERARGGIPQSEVLPKGAGIQEFTARIAALKTPRGGLPEEALFYRPEVVQREPVADFATAISPAILDKFKPFPNPIPINPINICAILSNDWAMYHGGQEHNGNANGCSDITSTTVNQLGLVANPDLEGAVWAIPTIVDGKIYVGTRTPSLGGNVYKIDLTSGHIDKSFLIPSNGGGTWGTGASLSPARVGNNVYVSAVDGKVYCLDAITLNLNWMTNLRNHDAAKNQPVDRPAAACWSSPLVVTTAGGHQRVYVGTGLGEDGPGTFGMIFLSRRCVR
jgi:hypothetical protein